LTNRVLSVLILSISATFIYCTGAPSRTAAPTNSAEATPSPSAIGAAAAASSDAAAGPRCLMKAYPDFLAGADDKGVRWKDGTSMPYDDGKVKANFDDLLDHANLKDQMSICYPKGDNYPSPPAVNNDPGRIRYEPFFLKMYGKTPAEVQKNLVPIIWLPKHLHKRLMVTTVNGIDQKFRDISAELDDLPDEYIKYLENPGGTFNWRVIAGTDRLSTHSFGMTVDINVALSDYWRSFKPGPNGVYQYRNRIPFKIADIFEKHGFIWGGKWYHFDTMHFEYRPELLDGDCVCKQ
jgi:peptidoglycan L-alanyl-D-glutamate endopeptidase CwlK